MMTLTQEKLTDVKISMTRAFGLLVKMVEKSMDTDAMVKALEHGVQLAELVTAVAGEFKNDWCQFMHTLLDAVMKAVGIRPGKSSDRITAVIVLARQKFPKH